MKVNCLRQMSLDEVSSCGRNWYLTEALVVEGLEIKPSDKQTKRRIYSGTMSDLFLLLTVLLDAEKTKTVTETAHFHFTDSKEDFYLQVPYFFREITFYLRAHNKEAEQENDAQARLSFFVLRAYGTITLFIQIRRGVMEVVTKKKDVLDDELALEVEVEDKVWREIMAKDRSAAAAVIKGDIVVRPGVQKLGKFMGYFDTSN